MNKTIESSSIDNEMQVLGAMLNTHENLSVGLKLVNENDFFEKKHKIIFKAMRTVFLEKNVVDISLIRNKLKVEENLEEAGGFHYLITLPQYAGTSSNIKEYCMDLKQLTAKRELISLSKDLVEDLQKSADLSKIIEKLKDKISKIEKNNTHT